MKRIISYILPLLLCMPVVLFTSCSEDDIDGYYATSKFMTTVGDVMLSYEEGSTQTFSVSANCNWNIKADTGNSGDWLTVYTGEGSSTTGSGNSTVTVLVKENTEVYSRSAVITITAEDGKLIRTVNVTQIKAGSKFEVTPKSMHFDEKGGEKIATAYTNDVVTVSSDQSDWCHVSTNNVVDNHMQSIVIKTDAVADGKYRTATITVTLNDHALGENNENIQTITVTQGMSDYELPNVSHEKLAYGEEGGDLRFHVDCNYAWTVTPENGDWFEVLQSKGNGSGDVIVRVSENTLEYERTATLHVKRSGVDQTVPVVITQEGRVLYLTASPERTEVGRDGGECRIQVASNTSWTCQVSDSWLQLGRENHGTGNEELTLQAEANPTSRARTATVTFYYTRKGETLTEVCTITQEAGYAADDWDNLPPDTPQE